MPMTSVIGSERSILSNQSSPVNRRYLWASGNEPQMRFFSFFCCSYSVTQSCPTLCNPMDCSTPGFPVLHHFLELSQTHVHWVDDAIQPPHPLLSLFSPALIFPSIRVFCNESALHISIGASASVLPMNKTIKIEKSHLMAVISGLQYMTQNRDSVTFRNGSFHAVWFLILRL